MKQLKIVLTRVFLVPLFLAALMGVCWSQASREVEVEWDTFNAQPPAAQKDKRKGES